jgi:2-succinyl-5-enolpyruvyl-6-hydroxy-3-cyclohexene-1-carboxylate synthase
MSFFLRGLRRPAMALAAVLSLFAAGFVHAEDVPTELMPEGTDIVAVIQVGKILKSPAFAKAKAKFPDVEAKLDEPMGKKTKFTPRQIESAFVAGNSETKQFVAVFTMTDDVEEAELKGDDEPAVETIGDYELYVAKDGNARCLVDDKVIAMGPTDTLRAVLKRGEEPEISEELEAAWEDVDDTKPLYVVATLEALMKKAGAGLPPGFPLTPDTLSKLEAAILTADPGEELGLNLDVWCGDAATAQQIKGIFDAVVAAQAANAQTPPPIAAALGTLKTSVDEDALTIEAKVGVDLILGLTANLGAGAAPPPNP